MAKSSAAHIKANAKYNKTHYKQLKINVAFGFFYDIDGYCNACGLSKAAFFDSSSGGIYGKSPRPERCSG